jgi:hypothetical protein
MYSAQKELVILDMFGNAATANSQPATSPE